MGDDAKSFLDLTMADLKSGVPAEPAAKPDGTPDAKVSGSPDAQLVFEREGIGASDEVIDIPNRPEVSALTEMLGGKEAMPAASQAFKEAMALGGVGLHNYDELVEGMTPEEEHAEIAETVREWNEVLANPMKAQALLQKIYAHPMQEPGKSYFMGRGSPALNDAIARLWAATTGEKYVRPKSKGDGHSY